MFAVIESSTGTALHLFDVAPEITEHGMVNPIAAPDISLANHSVIEVEPPAVQFLPGMMALAGGVWGIPDQAAYDALLARVNPAPAMPDLPLKKFRRALIEAGLFDAVEAAIAALPEPERSIARNEFEYSVSVVRTDPWVTELAVPLGLTSEQIDALWTWAAGL